MAKEERLIESKVGPGLCKLNVRVAWDRLFGKPSTSELVACRFLKLMEEHGIKPLQLLRLLPAEFGLTAADLQDEDSILGMLDDRVLTWLANTFSVKREWLEGEGEQIHRQPRDYKRLGPWLVEIGEKGILDNSLQLFLLHQKGQIPTNERGRRQPLILVLAHPFPEFDAHTVRRFVVSGEGWDYGYLPSRLHLKALARLFFLHMSQSTCLVPVKFQTLEAVQDGLLTPSFLPWGSGNCELFEARSLSSSESRLSMEEEELPAVLDFIRNQNLEEAFREAQRLNAETNGER
ncbi:MAG: hypothetical protein KAI66_08700 [Lentisphaeria bacterium]|nr:hypothetical protein [Lentisphaeria bacterium]